MNQQKPIVKVTSKQELINGVAGPVEWSIRVNREHIYLDQYLYGLSSEEIRLIRDELNKIPN